MAKHHQTLFEPLEDRRLLATFVVDLDIDESDGNTGPGDLSLREAIELANVAAGPDVIEFELGGPKFITLTLGSMTIADDLDIRGPGPMELALNANGASRVFTVTDNNATDQFDVAIRDMIMFDGNVATSGGAIFNAENLTLERVRVFMSHADAFGGGVYSGTGSTLSIINSTIDNNTSQTGGGVYATNATDVEIIQSTFSGNEALVDGGGIRLSSTPALILNSTFADNRADSDGNSTGGGGGIDLSPTADVTLISTIVGDNYEGTGSVLNDISGVLVATSHHNLIRSSIAAGALTNGVNNNIVGQNPDLLPLGNYGGLLPTHALEENSPAIDEGANPEGLERDQRGEFPFDRMDSTLDPNGGGLLEGAIDIGAYEFQELILIFDVTEDEIDDLYTEGSLSLREAVLLANRNPARDNVFAATEILGETITLTMGTLDITDEVTINGINFLDADLFEDLFEGLAPSFGLLLTIDANGMPAFDFDDNDANTMLDVSLGYLNIRGADNGAAVQNAEDLNLFGGEYYDNNDGVFDNFAGGEIAISLAYVHDNYRNGSGGALFSQGDARILSSTFARNTADGSGGAVWSIGDELNIFNSTFSGNRAGGNGGAIIATSMMVNIAFSTFYGNHADDDDDNAGTGGALYAPPSTIELLGVAFSMNFEGPGSDTPSEIEGTVSVGENNLIEHAGSAGGLTDGVDGNIIGQDALLGPLMMYASILPTHAPLPGSPLIDSGPGVQQNGLLQSDARMMPRPRGPGTDIGAHEVGSNYASENSIVRVTTDATDTHFVATINGEDQPAIFEEGSWVLVLPTSPTDAPATGGIVVWTDPKDGLVYAAYPSEDGLILLRRAANGDWTSSNLSDDTPNATDSFGDLTQFISTDGIVVIAAIAEGGDIVAFQQTGAMSGGDWTYTFVNISDDLTAGGFTTPELSDLISYVPSWNAWHLAGVDASGDIISVWVYNDQFTQWRLDNLSDITGASTLAGGLSVILTSWEGINLTGLDAAGNVVVTWWVPNFGGDWLSNNLTQEFNGPLLSAGALTGYYTSWDGMNYAGLDANGEITIYWWVPSFGGAWAVSTITENAPGSQPRPSGAITSHASDGGTLNIVGRAQDGEVVRASWRPGEGGTWMLEDLSGLVTLP